MLFKDSIPIIQVSWKVIFFATIITTLFFVFAVGMGIRAQRRKPVTGQEGLIGEIGEAITDFEKGKGQVAVHGEIWEGISTDKIKQGDPVKVISIENLKLNVRKNR